MPFDPATLHLTAWNTALFRAIVAPASSEPGTLARLCAGDLIVLAAAVPALLWLLGPHERRAAALSAVLIAVLALGMNLLVGAVWDEPRPFMLGLVPNWLGHAADGGLPSDHATVMWALGLPLLAVPGCRGWGALVVIAGAATAWARVHLGVHFPVDILGSLVVAALCATSLPAVHPVVRRLIVPGLMRLHARAHRPLRPPIPAVPNNLHDEK